VTRQDAGNTGKAGTLSFIGIAGQQQVSQSVVIGLSFKFGKGQDALDLRSREKSLLSLSEVKRPDAHDVAGQQKFLLLTIKQRNREIAFQVLGERFSKFAIGRKHTGGIGKVL